MAKTLSERLETLLRNTSPEIFSDGYGQNTDPVMTTTDDAPELLRAAIDLARRVEQAPAGHVIDLADDIKALERSGRSVRIVAEDGGAPE